jgi:thiol-disulfide isomerase/thioredoxin
MKNSIKKFLKPILIVVITVLVSFGIFVLCAIKSNKEAPNFALKYPLNLEIMGMISKYDGISKFQDNVDKLKKIDLDADYLKYKDDYKPVVYLFSTSYCNACLEEVINLNNIKKEYSANYNILVINDELENEYNNNFYNLIKQKFNLKEDIFPLVVVGDKAFVGSDDKTNQKIKQAIKANYVDKKSTYDVTKHLPFSVDILEMYLVKYLFILDVIFIPLGAVCIINLYDKNKKLTKELKK